MRISYYFSKFIKKMHIPAIKNCELAKKSHICPGTHLVNVQLGRYSYIGNYSTVLNCKIGNFCSIADNCTIGAMGHPIDWVSTSPVFYSGKNCLKTNFTDLEYDPANQTVIENDVWIGNGCNIKAGVKIDNGAIIGMGSVLTKDVGPYEIWAGNPAKFIRKRFDDETIEKLLESKWWNRTDAEITKSLSNVKTSSDWLKVIINEK